MLVLPALAVLAFVLIVPALQGVYYSLTNWDGVSPTFDFVGFANYVTLFSDPAAFSATLRTIGFAAAIAVFQTGVGLLLATVLSNTILGKSAYKTIFFMPVVILSVACAFIWQFILAPGQGALNQILTAIGLENLRSAWLSDPVSAAVAIVVVVVWQQAGISMAIYLAGFEAIPRDVYEAGALDGAGRFRTFFSIEMPMLAPATAASLLISLVYGLRMFDQILILTGGGPVTATQTLSILLYRTTFQYSQFGMGSTIAVILAVVVFVFAFIQQKWLSPRSLNA